MTMSQECSWSRFNPRMTERWFALYYFVKTSTFLSDFMHSSHDVENSSANFATFIFHVQLWY